MNCTGRVKFTHRARVKVYGRHCAWAPAQAQAAGGASSRRRSSEREPAQERAGEGAAEEREATPADRVLELQKTAGNRAVGAALARWGLPWLPLAAAPQWPKEPQVIIDGKS